MEITHLINELEALRKTGVTHVTVYDDATSTVSDISCVSEDDDNETLALLII